MAIHTMGIDVGSNFIKIILMEYSDNPILLDKQTEKIRKRNPTEVADEMVQTMLNKHKLDYDDIVYLASTGEGDLVKESADIFME